MSRLDEIEARLKASSSSATPGQALHALRELRINAPADLAALLRVARAAWDAANAPAWIDALKTPQMSALDAALAAIESEDRP